MIKFNTTLGAKHLNMEARLKKQMMQPSLKGLHCRKCAIGTEITFKIIPYDTSAPGNGIMVPVINACCDDFKKRIETKLSSQSYSL